MASTNLSNTIFGLNIFINLNIITITTKTTYVSIKGNTIIGTITMSFNDSLGMKLAFMRIIDFFYFLFFFYF